MRKLTLTNHVQSDTTVLENEFIDHYMAHRQSNLHRACGWRNDDA